MDLIVRMTLLVMFLTFLPVFGSKNSKIFTIETVLVSSCSLDTPCEDTMSNINLTESTPDLSITLIVTWTNRHNVFQLYSYIKSTESRNIDLLIIDEHLTTLMALPSPNFGCPYIILPGILWFEEEQPQPENFEDCCADLLFLEDLESDLPEEDVNNCLGWSEPSTGLIAVIRHLRWKEVIIIYDSVNEQEAKAVTAGLGNCQFVMHMIESSNSPRTQPESFINITSSLPPTLDARKNGDFQSKNTVEMNGEQIRDILRTLYAEVSVETNIQIVLLCSLDNMKSVLSLANRFDQENNKTSAMHLRSRWLISLPTDGSLNDELTNFFEDLDNLDNVAVIDSRYTEYKKDALNISANLKGLLTELVARVGHVKEKVDIWNLTNIMSQILQSKSDRCMDTRVNTLYFGKRQTRYLNTVAMVKVTQEVVLRGKDDVFPNVHFALNKRNLTVSFTEWTPFVMKNGQGYEGFCIDMLQHMESVLNFTAHVVLPKDGEWGERLENGSFNGLVGQLQRQEVDMVVAPLTMHPERAQVIDFSFPFFTDYTTVILKMPDPKESKWRTLIQPFKWQVHLAIWVSLFSVATLITILERQNPLYKSKSEKSAFHNLSDSIWYMYGSLLTQGGEQLPKSTTGLTLTSFWLMFAVIVASTYSGNLIAFLTVTIDTPPFDSLQGMLDQARYKWGTMGGTEQDLFQNQVQEHMLKKSNDPTKHMIWERIKSFNKSDPTVLSHHVQDHLDKVNKGDYAYLGDKSTIDFWINDDCNLKTIKETFFPKQYAVGLVKNSAYRYIVSNEIIKINDLGFFRMWSIRWWSKKKICQGNLVTEATPITVLDVQSAFYMMGIGIVLSALTLGAEKLAIYIRVSRGVRRYSFNRSASSRHVELQLNKAIKINQDGSEMSDGGNNGSLVSTNEVILDSDMDMTLKTQAQTLDKAFHGLHETDSFCADSMDSGYEDQLRRKIPYIFKDKVPFYLSRMSLPTFLGRNRSTSL